MGLDLKSINLKRRGVRPALLWLVLAVLLAAGGLAFWRHISDPPKPWLARWRLDRYLSRESRQGDFKIDFPFPSKAEMAKATAPRTERDSIARGSRTGKDFESLRNEYFTLKKTALALERNLGRAALPEAPMASTETAATEAAPVVTSNDTNAQTRSRTAPLRENRGRMLRRAAQETDLKAQQEALAPIVADLWEFQRQWIADAAATESGGGGPALTKAREQLAGKIEREMQSADSYGAMYRLIGQQLWVSKRLIASANPDHRRAGVLLAFNASRAAIQHAMNGWVAGRICEGFILPNIDLATDRNAQSPFHHESFLNQCAQIFWQNNEFENVARVYNQFLASNKNPQRADWALLQIARAYEQGGDPKNALRYLRQVRDTNTPLVARSIARLETQLKTQQ